ncbi:MAG: hypothetical protein A2X12_04160 [Bacteroidetes bacterium GWE2_29_8]|nr:MAG: hypothetical protein A2X12_04160 [Bacteroidetes bacterium GWE2_29_8]OFY24975.1 MAG: hypothetical protein A2X02_08005 [Bacteroidetes bacterium GWF2_29_10]
MLLFLFFNIFINITKIVNNFAKYNLKNITQILDMAYNHKVIYDLKDEIYDENDYGKYHLSVELDDNFIRYVIFDLKKYKYIFFREYELAKQEEKITEELSLIFSSDNVIQLPYYSKSFLINSNGNVIIPNSLFDFEQREKIFNLNELFNPEKEVIINESVKNIDSTLLYRMNKGLHNLVNESLGSSLIFLNNYNVLINSFITKYRNDFDEYKLCVNFRKSNIDVFLFKGQDLNIANCFQYNSANDILYYINYIIEIFKLKQSKFSLIIVGELHKNSSIYDKLKIYVKDISFIKRNESFNYSYIFDEFPENLHYSLLNSYQCV